MKKKALSSTVRRGFSFYNTVLTASIELKQLFIQKRQF